MATGTGTGTGMWIAKPVWLAHVALVESKKERMTCVLLHTSRVS